MKATSGSGLCILDVTFRVRFANDVAAEILGCSAGDLIDSDLQQQLVKLARSGPFDYGGRSAELTVLDGEGFALQFFPQAETSPRAEQFALIANSIPQLAWMARGDGYIFWYNQRWFDYTGTTSEQMQGWGWESVHDPQQLPRVVEKWRAALALGTPWEDTFPLRRHDGQMRMHLSRARPFHDERGELLFWFGTNTDIEEQLAQQRELVKAREQLTLSLEAGELGIFHCPLPFGEIFWNAKCKEHFFLPPDADVTFDLFNSVLHPADREPTNRAIQDSIEKGVAYDMQYRTVGPNGEIRWVRARGATYYDDKGQPLRFDGITIDVSAEVILAEERQALLLAEQSARLELERAGRMKDEFLATLSHELRTPLAAVLGWAQILQTLTEDEELLEGLKTIERNARTQQNLVEDLLDVSRIISGKLLLNTSLVDLGEIVNSAAEMLQGAALAKHIEIRVKREDGASWNLQGDGERLRQVVLNLVSNAIKFSPDGSKVSVELTRSPSGLELRVIDSGMGISSEFLPHIFERFRQSDSSTTRRFGGLGLGLSLAKQLVEMHGGTIGAANRDSGKGAVFSVLLPTSHERAGACQSDGNRPPVPVDPELIRGLRVVSVDDDADIRRWLECLLVYFGVTVLSASTAAEALELVQKEKPDVLLSDVGMPHEDGYSLIGKVRQLSPEQGGLVPAAALTAFARPEDRSRVLAAGFQMHLTKPLEPSKLVIALATLGGRLKPL